jgi:hypothetical protein
MIQKKSKDMSTNYYRIPKQKVVREKYLELVEQISYMDIFSPEQIYNEFRAIEKGFERWSPWDNFIDGLKIHIGKRSSGWKFLWNFQEGKFYTNKEELFKFIRSGKIVDEYGELQDTEEFIKMALEWGQPDGYVLDENYIAEQRKQPNYRPSFINMSNYYDKEIDGLRVSSSVEFS